jgi:hypothetical protein
MQLDYAKYDDDHKVYIINNADAGRDQIDPHPAIRELQVASQNAILRAARDPRNVVVKVAVGGTIRSEVRGYVTMARFLTGSTPQQFEKMLGFRDGALRSGCVVYHVDSFKLTIENIGPRAFSNWSAGVSPHDLQRLTESTGIPIHYHRDYPPAAEPIPQFVIFRPVPVVRGKRFNYGDCFDAV